MAALTRGGLADGKKRSNNELQEVSRGHSTKEKKLGKDRTIQSVELKCMFRIFARQYVKPKRN